MIQTVSRLGFHPFSIRREMVAGLEEVLGLNVLGRSDGKQDGRFLRIALLKSSIPNVLRNLHLSNALNYDYLNK